MIRVEMFPGRPTEQQQRFASAVTDKFVEICGGTRQSVQIVFIDVPKDSWATAGSLADTEAPKNHRHVKIG